MSFTEHAMNDPEAINLTAARFLDEAKVELNVTTDYQLAQKLEVSRSRLWIIGTTVLAFAMLALIVRQSQVSHARPVTR